MASKQFYELVITELTLIKLIRQLDENCKVTNSSYDTKGLVEFLAEQALDFTEMKMDMAQLDKILEKFKSERAFLEKGAKPMCCDTEPELISFEELKPGQSINVYRCTKCQKILKYELVYPLIWRGDEKTLFTKIE